MKKYILALVFILGFCHPLSAILISPYRNTPTYIERAKDIVIAKCISQPHFVINGGKYDVKIIRVLKGDKKKGEYKVFTVDKMMKGNTYLLSSSGGQARDTDFLATAELSVVPVASFIDIDKLEGKKLTEQLHKIFAGRLHEVERQLAQLLAEKKLLEKGLSDRTDNLFISTVHIQIQEIHTTMVKEYDQGHVIYLKLGTKQMQWSRGGDKRGYLYFQEPETNLPKWEIAFIEEKEFEALKEKELKLRFNGMYSPDFLGQSIGVSEGQIVAARHVDEPNVAYIMKLERQEQDVLFVRYFVLRQQIPSDKVEMNKARQ